MVSTSRARGGKRLNSACFRSAPSLWPVRSRRSRSATRIMGRMRNQRTMSSVTPTIKQHEGRNAPEAALPHGVAFGANEACILNQHQDAVHLAIASEGNRVFKPLPVVVVAEGGDLCAPFRRFFNDARRERLQDSVVARQRPRAGHPGYRWLCPSDFARPLMPHQDALIASTFP